MKLYEVIFWGADEYRNDEDTIYLVRATDWRAAVDIVRTNASPSTHKIHGSTLAHRVHEVGTDLTHSANRKTRFSADHTFSALTTTAGAPGVERLSETTILPIGGRNPCRQPMNCSEPAT